MAGAKPRTPPSIARQIYGKVPAKIFHTLFRKLLVAGNKTTKDLPKYGGNLHSKRDMCMHNILEKCRDPNYQFYNAQAKELDAQYEAGLYTVIATGMDYIWSHGAADIHMPNPVGSKRKMEN